MVELALKAVSVATGSAGTEVVMVLVVVVPMVEVEVTSSGSGPKRAVNGIGAVEAPPVYPLKVIVRGPADGSAGI